MYLPIYQFLRLCRPGGLVEYRLLQDLERTQWLPREELDSQKLARIQKLVSYAYEHVPYYHRLYQHENIHPKDLKTLDDFQAFPCLTKEEVVEHLNELVAPEFRNQVRERQTGGSTGMPMRFFVDTAFWRYSSALDWRSRRWYGVEVGEKVAWVWGAQTDLSKMSWMTRLKANLKQHRFLNAIYLNNTNMQAFAEMLVKWKPTMFIAYPAALSLFAYYIRENHITGIRPKLIETTAEIVTQSQRKLLEEVFQCKVANDYSSREMMQIAYQCEAGGLHVNEEHHLELIANGRTVPTGQIGEVVLTSLYQYAMPFIRYKILDTAIEESAPCPCGRELPFLREILGRTSDFIVTADGQYTDEAFFDYLFEEKPEVAQYQIYQPDVNHIEVYLVCRQKLTEEWLDNLHKELHVPFPRQMNIEIRLVDKIQLNTSGKHRLIISKVKPAFVS